MKRKRTCGRCPRWSKCYCPIKAKLMLPDAPSCAYGERMMHNAYSAEWMRRKHGYKKRGKAS